MAHIHSVYDTDPHFTIDPTTRAIKNESTKNTTVIQYDHNSERFTFEIPRYIDGHDMTQCNKVEVHYINKDTKGIYIVDDMQLSPSDDNVAIFSWLVSQNATRFIDKLRFSIRFSCVTNEVVDYAWNTAIYSDISVSSGIFNNETVVEQYADVLEKWKLELINAGTLTDEDISNAVDTYMEKNPVDISNSIIDFEQQATRTNLKTGESIKNAFGKIAKFFNDLKTVAFTGSYTDLLNKPTIPTKTSDLNNDSNFLTQHQPLDGYAKKTDIPSVPTKTSELENDSNFLTEHQPIKTINGKSLLGSGDIEIQGDGSSDVVDLTKEQSLTDEEQATVRKNISAVKVWLSEDGTTLFIDSGGGSKNSVTE